MLHQKIKKASSKKTFALIMVLVAFSLLQICQIAYVSGQTSSSNQWAMAIQIQEAGQNSASTVFAPFDQIQLYANVTYGNLAQPNMLVSFKVESPTNSVNITRIETTNSSGIAQFVFRPPIDGESQDTLMGTWQAFATVQTTNAPIQENLTFTVQWNQEITSIIFNNSGGQQQTQFSRGDKVTTQIAITSNQIEPVNITLNFADSAGNKINQTQIGNVALNASANNKVQNTFQVPNNATLGLATVNASMYSGAYLGVPIQVCQKESGNFTITNGGANPTPTPTTTPTAPPSSENSISLFSWLLVATGFFTFTTLYMTLRKGKLVGFGQCE